MVAINMSPTIIIKTNVIIFLLYSHSLLNDSLLTIMGTILYVRFMLENSYQHRKLPDCKLYKDRNQHIKCAHGQPKFNRGSRGGVGIDSISRWASYKDI